MAVNIEVTSEDLSTVQSSLEAAGHTVEVETEKPSGEPAPEKEKPAGSEPSPADTGAAPTKEKKEETPKTAPIEDWNSLPKWAQNQIVKLRERQRELRDRLEDERAARSIPRQPAGFSETPRKEAVETPAYCGRPKPKISDFEQAADQYAAFAEASAEWFADEKIAKSEAERATHASAQGERAVMAQFVERQKEAEALSPDMAETLEGATDLIATPAMQYFIYRSEVGPHVMLHLAENPGEFHRIAAMNPADTAKAIGRLEVKVEAQVQALREAKGKANGKPSGKSESPRTKTVSSAPQPETALRGQAPAGKTLAEIAGPPDRMVDITFDREYERKRNEQRRQA